MANPSTIHKVVRTLCSAHGREPKDETFDAYSMALAEYSDAEVESGLITALREQREFMPPPGIVAGFAKDTRNSRLRAANAPDERRLVCGICQDRGNVTIVNRHWLLEHRDKFSDEWFVAGWMRDAELWCRTHTNGQIHGRKAFLWMACCFCECHNARTYREQAKRYAVAMRNNQMDEKRSPRPAFGSLFDRDLDCMTNGVERADVQTAILAWADGDRDGRTWSGNWNPQ